VRRLDVAAGVVCGWLPPPQGRGGREEAAANGGEVEEEWRAGEGARRSPTRCGAKGTDGREAERNGSAAACVGRPCSLACRSRGSRFSDATSTAVSACLGQRYEEKVG
jgi:hypothetical protein